MSREETNELGPRIEEFRGYIEVVVRRRADAIVLAKESVADLVQSISRELIEENDSFEYRGEAEFKAFLNQVIRSKIIEKHRYYTAQKRDARSERAMPGVGVPDEATPSQNVGHAEDHARVTSALEQLPEDYREVLRLFWFERLRHAEIAVRMGRREDAVRKLLSRAKARLGLAIEQLKAHPE